MGRKRYGVLADTVLQPASPNVVWEMRRLRYSDAIQAQKDRVTKMSKEISVIAGAVGSCTAVVVFSCYKAFAILFMLVVSRVIAIIIIVCCCIFERRRRGRRSCHQKSGLRIEALATVAGCKTSQSNVGTVAITRKRMRSRD